MVRIGVRKDAGCLTQCRTHDQRVEYGCSFLLHRALSSNGDCRDDRGHM
jgi:hypothetical protein